MKTRKTAKEIRPELFQRLLDRLMGFAFDDLFDSKVNGWFPNTKEDGSRPGKAKRTKRKAKPAKETK